jgi:hypothetical protein
MPTTTGMKGDGFYDRHSQSQLSTIRALQDWIDDAVTKLPLPSPSQPVTILDLGSSEGGNAIWMMRHIVLGLRRRTSQPIQTVYSDLTTNNFNQFFANLDRGRRADFPEGVYASAVGGSFYGPLLPPATVHLACCFNAIQWLDELPAIRMPNAIAYRRPHPHRPGLTVSPEVSAAFQRQAEQDLVRFLECRAQELVPGGKLLVAAPGDTDQARVGDGFADVLNDACLDLIEGGDLQREKYEALTMPVYFRTVDELVAPLERGASPVRGAFVVDRADALEVPSPFVVEFRRSGDTATYARAYSDFMRAITEPVVRAAINPSGEESGTVNRLYERVRARVQADPERYLFRYLLVAALFTRC